MNSEFSHSLLSKLNINRDEFLSIIEKVKKSPEFEAAAAIWVNLNEIDEMSTKKLFQEAKTDFYELTDAKAINNWVSEHTHNRITDLLDSVDPTLSMIITSAIYFKAKWDVPFKSSDTFESTFKGDHPTKVKFMSQRADHTFFFDGKEKGILKKYANSEYSAVFIDAADVNLALDKLKHANEDEIEIQVPKFKITSKIENEIEKALEELGVGFIYRGFDGPIFKRRQKVDYIIQKAFLCVDEDGTEAAAATAIAIRAMSMPHPVPRLVFDSPFTFMIIRNNDFLPIFTARITEI